MSPTGGPVGIVTGSRWARCLRCGKHFVERRVEVRDSWFVSKEPHACPNPVVLAEYVDDPEDDAVFGDSGVR